MIGRKHLLNRPIYGPCIHQCTFVNLPESVKIFTGNSLVSLLTRSPYLLELYVYVCRHLCMDIHVYVLIAGCHAVLRCL